MQGPSFTVVGNKVYWQGWQFRVGFTPTEGLVLTTVAIEDQAKGTLRPVAYRMRYVLRCKGSVVVGVAAMVMWPGFTSGLAESSPLTHSQLRRNGGAVRRSAFAALPEVCVRCR